MQETTDTQSAESSQETGVIGRMVGTLFSPGRTFASVNKQVEHQDWLIPLIVIAIVGMLSAYLIMPMAQTGEMEAMREQLQKDEAFSDEQQTQVLKVGSIIGILVAAIGTVATLFIQAAIFLALANFVLGGDGTYKKTLAVVSYSSLVGIPDAIVTVPLMLIKESMKVQVGLSLLLPGSMEGGFLFHSLSMLNLFSIWQFSLIAVGLGAVADIRTRRAAYGVFGLWIVYVLITSATQNLSGSMI